MHLRKPLVKKWSIYIYFYSQSFRRVKLAAGPSFNCRLVLFYTKFMTRWRFPADQSMFLDFTSGLQKTHQRDLEVRWFVREIYGGYKVVFVHMFQLCLQMSCRIISGLSVPSYKHEDSLSITFLDFLALILSLTFQLFNLTTVVWKLPSFFFLFTLRGWGPVLQTPLWNPGEQGVKQQPSLLLWCWGLWARQSQYWRHLHLMCIAMPRRAGMGGNKAMGSFSFLHDTSWK